jgi:hypothetical protein
MKRALLLLPFLAAVGLAAPKAETSPDGLRIQTARYAATFDPGSGLMKSLSLADGTQLVTGSRLYSDVLPDGRRSFSAKADAPAKATPQPDGALLIEVRGKLLDEDGKQSPTFPFAYSATYRFDETAEVRVSVALIPEFDSEGVFGFAGHVLSTATQREFFVNTADGLISEMAATRPGRTYQSDSEPLALTNPYVGVLLGTGQVLQFRLTGGMASLLNVFFHDSGSGPTHLFLCPLSGNNGRTARKGEEWRHEMVVQAMPLADWAAGD